MIRAMTRSYTGRWLPEIATAIGLIIAPWILPSLGFNADIMSRIVVWGLFGLGFDLLFGFTGLLSFGQAAFFGAGGFVTAYLVTAGIVNNVLICLVIGTLVAAIYGVVIGILSLRRTGIYFAMLTLAFGEMSYFLENSPLSQWTGGENGLPGVPEPAIHLGFIDYVFHTGWPMYAFLATLFWVGFLIARRIIHSPFGVVMISIRENTGRAIALGHKVHHYKLAVFVVAAAYGGLAGGLLGVLQNYMPPDAFALATSGQLVMQTVIGGAGTLFGPLLGATVWLWLRGTLQYIPDVGAAWKLILGAVFVILVTLFRRGLCGELIALPGGLRRARMRRASPDEATRDAHTQAPPGGAETGGVQARAVRVSGDDALVQGHVPQLKPRRGVAALEAVGLTKHYGGVHAVTDVSVTIDTGELRALIGPNGAGKSTLFKMLAGEIKPTNGEVYLHGERMSGLGASRVCQFGLSKSYQINQLFNSLTARENLLIPVLARMRGPFAADMLKSLHRVPHLNEQVERTLALVGLSEQADLPTSVLPYGEKRRLEIALALATSPSVLLLDEPLAGMSPAERADTVALLKELRKGRTLVVVEHDMDAIFSLAERISVLYEGELLADGTPDEIQSNPKVQDAYLGGMSEHESA